MNDIPFTVAGQLSTRPMRQASYPSGRMPRNPKGRARHLAKLARFYRELAFTDELTGLANRTAWNIRSETEYNRAKRTGNPALFFMIDCDGFKPINDAHGHAAGDIALQQIARVIDHSLRASDLIARTGGDEFCGAVTISPPADPNKVQDANAVMAAALEIMGRIRDAVKNSHLMQDQRFAALSVSVGGTLYYGDHTPLADLMQAADKALYMSKDRRNWITLSDTQPEHGKRKNSSYISRMPDLMRSAHRAIARSRKCAARTIAANRDTQPRRRQPNKQPYRLDKKYNILCPR